MKPAAAAAAAAAFVSKRRNHYQPLKLGSTRTAAAQHIGRKDCCCAYTWLAVHARQESQKSQWLAGTALQRQILCDLAGNAHARSQTCLQEQQSHAGNRTWLQDADSRA
jgi:hypothetical protein